MLQSVNSPAWNTATALEISANLTALAMILVVVVKRKKAGCQAGCRLDPLAKAAETSIAPAQKSSLELDASFSTPVPISNSLGLIIATA